MEIPASGNIARSKSQVGFLKLFLVSYGEIGLNSPKDTRKRVGRATCIHILRMLAAGRDLLKMAMSGSNWESQLQALPLAASLWWDFWNFFMYPMVRSGKTHNRIHKKSCEEPRGSTCCACLPLGAICLRWGFQAQIGNPSFRQYRSQQVSGGTSKAFSCILW